MSAPERIEESGRTEGVSPEPTPARENQPPISPNAETPAFRRTTLFLATLGVVAVPFICSGLWMLMASPRSEQGSTESEAESAIRMLQEVQEEDQKLLNSYDLSKTPIRIPITRAMALIAQEEAARATDASKDNPSEVD